ncbi:MAG TPA: ABC transporter substrate-binding protein, partial [Bdellovibrio sp.]|nr:ABC transporter substrate-binding protein [Bdellovibrio sp.]
MFQLLGRAFTASFLAVFSLSTSPANASNILIFADQLQLDLTKSQNMYDYAVARCIHRSLVRRDPVGHLRADAAQSWKVSKDRTQYDFELAPLQFHNGAHLNSTIAVDSLKASFRGQSDIARLVSPHIEKVEAIDGNHVRITLYKPYEPLMKALSTADFVIKMASKEQNSDLVGLGPYRASLVDRHLSLRNIADNTDLNIAYSRDVRVLKKALTYVDAAFGIPNRIALEPIEGMNSKLKIHFVNNLSFSHYLINPNRPFSKDKARRQMLRQSIMQSLSLQREKWMEQFGALTSILPLGVLNRTAEKPFPSLPVDKWKG